MSTNDSDFRGKTTGEIHDRGGSVDSKGNVINTWGHGTDLSINQNSGKAETKPYGQG